MRLRIKRMVVRLLPVMGQRVYRRTPDGNWEGKRMIDIVLPIRGDVKIVRRKTEM